MRRPHIHLEVLTDCGIEQSCDLLTVRGAGWRRREGSRVEEERGEPGGGGERGAGGGGGGEREREKEGESEGEEERKRGRERGREKEREGERKRGLYFRLWCGDEWVPGVGAVWFACSNVYSCSMGWCVAHIPTHTHTEYHRHTHI